MNDGSISDGDMRRENESGNKDLGNMSIREERKSRVCPHASLWPVASCHAKNGRVHLPSDETVKLLCSKSAYTDCALFQKNDQGQLNT